MLLAGEKKNIKCCDIVPTGHIAVHVKINSSLCKRHGALRLPLSKSGECISHCRSSPAATQALAEPLPLLGLERVLLFQRPRTHRSNFLIFFFFKLDFISSKQATLVLINEYVSLLLLLGSLPGPAFSCLENKMFHSKQNPLCPCVWPLLAEVRELGRRQQFRFWGWRTREGEMVRITEERQRKGKLCNTHRAEHFQFSKSCGKSYICKSSP